jgi:hypothetical protein
MSSDWRRTAAASPETGYREAVYPLYQPVAALRQEIEAPSNLGEPLIVLRACSSVARRNSARYSGCASIRSTSCDRSVTSSAIWLRRTTQVRPTSS